MPNQKLNGILVFWAGRRISFLIWHLDFYFAIPHAGTNKVEIAVIIYLAGRAAALWDLPGLNLSSRKHPRMPFFSNMRNLVRARFRQSIIPEILRLMRLRKCLLFFDPPSPGHGRIFAQN